MPYKVVKRGGKFVVLKKDGNKVVGTHDHAADALKHMRALYANVPDAKKK